MPIAEAAPRRREKKLDEKFAARDAAWRRQPEILQTEHRVFRGDARVMAPLTLPESIDLVVTSPPYWDLKQYDGAAGDQQLGHVPDRDQFLAEMDRVWRRCFDLLRPGGRLCVVVGDVCRSRKAHGRHVVEPLHAYLQVRCQAIGFDPLAPIIWRKIANATTEMGGANAFLGKPYEPNAIIKNDIEFILLFRKAGGYRHPTQEQRDLSLIDRETHRRWFQQVWADVPGEIQRDHPAPFPAEIARRLIGMFSFVGDTVLDPFWGTGTTTVAAMEMHRNSVGFEIEPSYLAVGRRRLQQPPLHATLAFVTDDAGITDSDESQS